MTKPLERDAIYLKRHFDAEIIVLSVRWYITYKLSYRDLAAMMAERGVVVSHTTIMRWVIRYAPSSRSVGVGSRVIRRLLVACRRDLHRNHYCPVK
jgi:transposase-like protein